MVRTKQTGKRSLPKSNGTPKVNGTPKPKATPKATPKTPAPAPPQDPQSIKSPTQQPAELSDGDRSKIKSWLDKQEKPFGVATAPISKKRKRTSGQLQVQSDLFEPRLSVQYEVKPKDKWECLRRYKKFTVGAESIAVGENILVKHDDVEDARIDVTAQWKAKVLEVRALDPEHVYIRLAWLNRPEDLDTGRKSYHGKNELIPTNQMDVIDAMAVNGSLTVEHWEEKDDDKPMPSEDTYFWRQTYDFANTKTFSELRSICIDSAPQNPDEMILQCGNKECRKWMHVKCIAEDAVQQADGATPSKKSPRKKARPNDVSIDAKSRAQAKAQTDSVTAEVLMKGLPTGEDQTPAEKSEIIVTNADGQKQTRDLVCLFCKHEIE